MSSAVQVTADIALHVYITHCVPKIHRTAMCLQHEKQTTFHTHLPYNKVFPHQGIINVQKLLAENHDSPKTSQKH